MSSNAPQLSRQLTLITFTGEDASSFLQGQLTNDVNRLEQQWQWTGYCNPKGRLLALMKLWRHNKQFYALIHSSIADSTIKRLRMYVMRSKVEIQAHQNILLSFQYKSQRPAQTTDIDNGIHTLHFGSRALSIQTNSNDEMNSYPEDWASLNIAEGLPEISDKSVELFVPQMINLDILDGINFKKGCYTGQEIVARMHYLGKLKQRMYVCNLTHNCEVGAKVMSDEKNAGHIVSCSQNTALAVLRNEYIDTNNNNTLTIDADDDETKIGLSVNDKQPYSLELKS